MCSSPGPQVVLRCTPASSGIARQRITALAVLPPPPPPSLLHIPALPLHPPLPGPYAPAAPPLAHPPASPGPYAVLLTKERPGHALVQDLGTSSGGAGRCWTVPAVRGRVTALAACPRGASVAIGTTAGTVFLWRPLPPDVPVPPQADAFAFAAEGAAVAAAGPAAAVSAQQQQQRQQQHQQQHPAPEWHLCGRLGWPEVVLRRQEAAWGGGGKRGGGRAEEGGCEAQGAELVSLGAWASRTGKCVCAGKRCLGLMAVSTVCTKFGCGARNFGEAM